LAWPGRWSMPTKKPLRILSGRLSASIHTISRLATGWPPNLDVQPSLCKGSFAKVGNFFNRATKAKIFYRLSTLEALTEVANTCYILLNKRKYTLKNYVIIKKRRQTSQRLVCLTVEGVKDQWKNKQGQ
jgi:hypothetical protein